MTTHTIALFGDWLIATAPDGDAAKLAERIAAAKGQGIDFDDADLHIVTGLTLIGSADDEIAAEEAGAEIVYSGTDQGWLQDEHGNTVYHAAVRMPARAARTIDATPTWAGLTGRARTGRPHPSPIRGWRSRSCYDHQRPTGRFGNDAPCRRRP